jgi:transposase InsO family protein
MLLRSEQIGYTWGSLFVDHASGKIFNFPQYSTNVLETVRTTLCLEALAKEKGFKIKEYHSTNGIFSSNKFKEHCVRQSQKYTFGGVGAKRQNGVAERNIKTVAQWACANMLHLATHWPQHANSTYWPQAINYAAWVFNRLPNMELGISPNEIWSCVRSSSTEISHTHIFGFPVYVLDASLQDGKKIPK